MPKWHTQGPQSPSRFLPENSTFWPATSYAFGLGRRSLSKTSRGSATPAAVASAGAVRAAWGSASRFVRAISAFRRVRLQRSRFPQRNAVRVRNHQLWNASSSPRPTISAAAPWP